MVTLHFSGASCRLSAWALSLPLTPASHLSPACSHLQHLHTQRLPVPRLHHHAARRLRPACRQQQHHGAIQAGLCDSCSLRTGACGQPGGQVSCKPRGKRGMHPLPSQNGSLKFCRFTWPLRNRCPPIHPKVTTLEHATLVAAHLAGSHLGRQPPPRLHHHRRDCNCLERRSSDRPGHHSGAAPG